MEVLGLLPLLQFPYVNNFGGKKERKNLPVEKEEDLSK